MNVLPLVRAASSDDLSGLLVLCRHLDVPGKPPPDPARAAAAWSRLLALAGTTVFVAELPGPPPLLAATCSLFVLPNLTYDARPHALIENVATLDTHGRQGLGRVVLDAAIAAAWAAGCYKVLLTTGSSREETLRFYERAGFARNTRTVFEMRQAPRPARGTREA